MIADQKRPVAIGGRRKFSGNHSARPGLQGRRQMFFVLDKNQVVREGRCHAGDTGHFNTSIADQSGFHHVSDVLQRALHGFHCIAAPRRKKATCGRKKRRHGQSEPPRLQFYGTVQVAAL